MPPHAREALAALFAIDAAMGDVVRTTSEPMVAAIRLAWWRERLQDLDAAVAAPAEPRLRAVQKALLPRGVAGRDLARLEDGWLRLFDPFPWDSGTAEAIWFRGRLLFALGAKVLDRTDDDIEDAGGIWAMVDVARHCSDAQSRQALLREADKLARGLTGTRFPRRLRPLSQLAALAARDCAHGEPFEAQGSRRRALAALKHRLTGRLPRP